MAVKTSGSPDVLYNDWAASRSQSMQRPKSLHLKSQLVIRKIQVILITWIFLMSDFMDSK